MSALTAGKQFRRLSGGHDDYAPQKASTIVYAGGIVMLDASGRAIPGATATGSIGVGVALTNRDLDRYDNTSGADGDIQVRWDEGILGPFVNSGGGDAFATSDQPGIPVFIVDDQTVAKTSNGATRSPAGRFHHLDADGVWVEMSKVIGAQLAKEAQIEQGTVMTQTYATASSTVPADTSHAIADNTGAAPSTTALAAVTSPTAVTNNSGGSTGDTTIAAITQAGTAGSADITPTKDAIAKLAVLANADAAAIIVMRTSISTLAAELALCKADALATKKALNAVIDILQAAGIAA